MQLAQHMNSTTATAAGTFNSKLRAADSSSNTRRVLRVFSVCSLEEVFGDFPGGAAAWNQLQATTLHLLPQRISSPDLQVEIYNSSGTPIHEHYSVEWSERDLVLRTLSPDYNIICYTTLMPVRATVSIQRNLTTPTLLPDDFTRLHLSPDVKAWIQTALDFAEKLIAKSDDYFNALNTLQRELESQLQPEMAAYLLTAAAVQSSIERDYATPAEASALSAAIDETGGLTDLLSQLAARIPPEPKLPIIDMQSCYGTQANALLSMRLRNDSCVSSEVDKLFLGYLRLLLSDVPPVAVNVNNMTDSVTGLPWEPPFGQFTTPYYWGPMESRFVPNKAANAFMLVLLVLVVVLMLILHALANPGQFGFRDAAPWMMLADVPNPPKPLLNMGGKGLDQILQQERSMGIVLFYHDDGLHAAAAEVTGHGTPAAVATAAAGAAACTSGGSAVTRAVVHVGTDWQCDGQQQC
jgi:hypothetical protein